MCESKEILTRKQLLTGEVYYENLNQYYTKAATYASRISAGDFSGKNAKYKPVFRLNLEDFSPKLKAELSELPKERIHEIVTIAVFRLFKARHRMIFHQHIETEGLIKIMSTADNNDDFLRGAGNVEEEPEDAEQKEQEQIKTVSETIRLH